MAEIKIPIPEELERQVEREVKELADLLLLDIRKAIVDNRATLYNECKTIWKPCADIWAGIDIPDNLQDEVLKGMAQVRVLENLPKQGWTVYCVGSGYYLKKR